MCGEVMLFPETVEEFIKQYKIVDDQHVYTNGVELIPVFRVEQWLAHEDDKEKFDTAKILHFLATRFGAPCNFFYDYDINIGKEEWCEENCDKVPAEECWERAIQAWYEKTGVNPFNWGESEGETK